MGPGSGGGGRELGRSGRVPKCVCVFFFFLIKFLFLFLKLFFFIYLFLSFSSFFKWKILPAPPFLGCFLGGKNHPFGGGGFPDSFD